MMVSRTKKSHLGVGLYSLAEAARLIGVHPSRLHRWASPDSQLVPRYFDPAESTLTFRELMELQFVGMFRGAGVSLQTIRKASATASKLFRTDCPFSVKRFDTDGRTVFATLLDEQNAANEEMVEDLRRGQYVFSQIVRPFFKKLDYHGALEVARYWPCEKSGRIVLDPARKFGKPIDAETGVPTSAIFDAYVAGRGKKPSAVAEWLGVPLAAVEAAVNFERSIQT